MTREEELSLQEQLQKCAQRKLAESVVEEELCEAMEIEALRDMCDTGIDHVAIHLSPDLDRTCIFVNGHELHCVTNIRVECDVEDFCPGPKVILTLVGAGLDIVGDPTCVSIVGARQTIGELEALRTRRILDRIVESAQLGEFDAEDEA